MHILDKIVAHKKKEVEISKTLSPIANLEASQYFNRCTNSFARTLSDIDQSGVISEFKRKSPSKKNINLSAKVEEVAPNYVAAGSGAISILTDHHFFGGQNDLLTKTRTLLPDTPLLRKEFIIDEYQIIEAKSIGADIILLIAEILTKEEISNFARTARDLDLEVLLELHDYKQIEKYSDYVSMVGVNNRDLNTFEVDFDRSKKLFNDLPVEIPKIAESGLKDAETLIMLYNYGFRGFLIGEQFMKSKDPGKACRLMIGPYMNKRNYKISENV